MTARLSQANTVNTVRRAEGFESGGKGEQAAGLEVPSGRTGLIFEV